MYGRVLIVNQYPGVSAGIGSFINSLYPDSFEIREEIAPDYALGELDNENWEYDLIVIGTRFSVSRLSWRELVDRGSQQGVPSIVYSSESREPERGVVYLEYGFSKEELKNAIDKLLSTQK